MENVCISCRRPKATIACDLCHEPLCKNCEHFLDATTFSFLATVPENLTHTHYCPVCFNAQVEPALESYNEVMERAKKVYFYFKTQKRPPPILKKSKERVEVKDCDDRDETILRLAFFAAEQGFNGIIEAEVISEKVRNKSYQTSVWRGVGIPASVDGEKIERET
ncbi:MAG: hypothetical protein ACXWP5_10815 [Bdellovibrionota bacterium]